MLRKLIANRNLLKNLVVRDLKHRYVGSMAGFLWSVIHPIVLLVVYTFVFTTVMGQRLGPEAGTESFPLFLFCGMLPWLLFQDTVLRSCSSITNNTSLITKTVIPAEILPIAITLSNLVNHLIGLAILLIALISFHSLHLSLFWLLIYMPILLLMTQGLGWIAAGLQVFFRDTIQILQIVMMLWFWFTPIFYASTAVPPRMQTYLSFNPIALIVTGYRNSLLHISQPSLLQVAATLALSVAVFVIGAFLFRRAKPAFADVL